MIKPGFILDISASFSLMSAMTFSYSRVFLPVFFLTSRSFSSAFSFFLSILSCSLFLASILSYMHPSYESDILSCLNYYFREGEELSTLVLEINRVSRLIIPIRRILNFKKSRYPIFLSSFLAESQNLKSLEIKLKIGGEI